MSESVTPSTFEDEKLTTNSYSDDEDTSYKIRRSATKLLTAVIGTRPELLITLYKDVSPVLITRFGDREETVRLEVWSTYGTLLNQTKLYSSTPQAKDAQFNARKRKREEGSMEVEETPITLLRSQVPSLAKALLQQLKSAKTPVTTLQGGFSLLHTLLTALPGCLSAQSAQIISNAKIVLSQSTTGSSANLQVSCLAFVGLFFSTHPSTAYSSSLDSIIPTLLKSISERHPKIASEGFRTFSGLLNALKPVQGGAWVDRVYDEAVSRLGNHDTDAEVRLCAEQTIANLWICATDVVKNKGGKEWDAICRATARNEGAVDVVTRVALKAEVSDQWVNGCVEWVLGLLKKSGRSGKSDVFTCLDALLRRYSAIPADLPPSLIYQLKLYISTNDISLLAAALNIAALLLELAPSTTFPEVERDLLQDIYNVAHSPLVSGAPFDSVLNFFAALVQADMQIATHVVPNLVISIDKASKSEASQANVARCIGQVVKCQQPVAAGTIAEFAKHLKVCAASLSVM